MFKRILVPLDGSARAERALAVAARLAQASSGSIILLRVVSNTNELWIGELPPRTQGDSPFAPELTQAERYLAHVTVSPDLKAIPTETVTLVGSPAHVILSVASSYQADLILLCSHGYAGMTRWIMGSVAEKVARHALLPVLVLREGGPVPAGPHPDASRPLRVLVPLDGSAYAKAALLPAATLIAALAGPGQGAMHLLRVVPPPHEGKQDNRYAAALQKARGYLQLTVEHLREGWVASPVHRLNLTITWSVAVETDVAEALVRVAENGEDAEGAGVFGGCDVIALASHGRSGLQRWAMGNVAERVLAATKLPLLIVRPPEMIDWKPVNRTQKVTTTP
ncbi:MAG TPA: universal stress protein [Ktedonobacteraceae bacterium]|nr:universal stress protein [Ktedonobacteraceae bacterium]